MERFLAEFKARRIFRSRPCNPWFKLSWNRIKSDPAVDNVMAFTGGNGAVNGGFVYLGLKPLDERNASASQVINRLRPKLTSTPGATVFLQAGQDLRIGGRQSNAQYQYTIQSDNIQDLVKWGPSFSSR